MSKTTLLLPRAIAQRVETTIAKRAETAIAKPAETAIAPNLISSQTHQYGNHQPKTPRDELCILRQHD